MSTEQMELYFLARANQFKKTLRLASLHLPVPLPESGRGITGWDLDLSDPDSDADQKEAAVWP